MVKKDSLYSINKKNPDAVVYKFANGEEHRITREDFPTEEAFLAFKAWSDENFHEEERLDHREANRIYPKLRLPPLRWMLLWNASISEQNSAV